MIAMCARLPSPCLTHDYDLKPSNGKNMAKFSRHKILSKGLRRQRGEMNRTEAAYAKHLAILQAAGEIAGYWFEPFSLRLSRPDAGQPARYTPDFMILAPDGTTWLDDCKNKSGVDDQAGIVRIKCAAEMYPLWIFRLVRPSSLRGSGGWEIVEV